MSKWGQTVCTGYRLPISLSTAAAYIFPPQRTPPGSGEVLERDRGSKSPVSFQPPPRGVNKIYTYDVVFPPGEARSETISQTQIPFTPPRGANKIYRSDAVFLIGEANTNDQSQTQFPYKITKDISQPQFDKPTAGYSTNPPTASQSTCPQVRASRAARYWMPRHPRTCRAIRDCKSNHRTSSATEQVRLPNKFGQAAGQSPAL